MAPAPRPSHSAEAARAAAAQAEFNEKKWVWVPDDKEGYLSGWVVNEEGEEGDVVLASGGDVRCCYRNSMTSNTVFVDEESAIDDVVQDEPAQVRSR